ncbi:MAG: hypothetical protein QN229_03185 [Desulfurococcaceae archaeon TW002]
MTVSDEIFFNYIKIRTHRTLHPENIKRINELVTYTFPGLLSALQEFEISSCLGRELRSDLPLSRIIIYSKLLKCWENDLRNVIRLIKPSENVVNVIDLYISKYVINDLTGIISAGLKETTYLDTSVAESLKTAKEVSEIISVMSKKGFMNEVISTILGEYRRMKISELDVGKLSRKLSTSYFRSLENTLRKLNVSSYGLRCVEFLKEFEEAKPLLRKTLLKKRDLRTVATMLTQKQREVILRASKNTHDFEYVLSILPTHSCHNMLKSLPVSADTLLDYLLLKEIEFSFLSYVIYLINSGYSLDLIKEEVRRWLEFYESITK